MQSIDYCHHTIYSSADAPPIRRREDEDREFSLRKVLLVAQVLVRRDNHLEAGSFGGF